MKKRILVTGGAGFIGSAFVRLFAERYAITVVDKLTYAGKRSRLGAVKPKIEFIREDVGRPKEMAAIFKKKRFYAVVHFAAETHVDKSLKDIQPFIQNNVLATASLLTLTKKHRIQRFIHISTDEVYGERKKGGRFKESAPLKPRNPYAATKAAAEFLVQAAIRRDKLPAIIARPANHYGPWQLPEKFIAVAITRLLAGKKIPVYGKGRQIREWLYVDDGAAAIELLLRKGKKGEIYNIGSSAERRNIDTARLIGRLMGGKDPVRFVADRPGHDFRYGINCQNIRRLGWRPLTSFKNGLQQTIHWYQNQAKGVFR